MGKQIDLNGKIAIVTGGGGCIGSGIGRAFAEAGAKVYLADVVAEVAEKQADLIRKALVFLPELLENCSELLNIKQFRIRQDAVAPRGQLQLVFTAKIMIKQTHNRPSLSGFFVCSPSAC